MLAEILGPENHCVSISAHMARYLRPHLVGDATYHIQFKDHELKPLDRPVLWLLSEWRKDADSYLQAKERSRIRREQEFIFRENLKRVARAITKFSGVEGDVANVLAYRKLRDNKGINFLQVKLATTIEET